ncbi:MAG: FAD binding domain-containing protein [Acidimicrobiia bacterium]
MEPLSTNRSPDFRSAHSLDEALAALGELGEAATILAGGTDVMIQHLRGEIAPECLLHIENVTELKDVTSSADVLTVGSMVTHRRVGRDKELAARLPALAEACLTVGGWQTQAVGTVVGNLCNASPAADTVPALLTADAVVHLASKNETRTIPVREFVTGRRSNAARSDELVTALDLQACRPGSGEVYLKVAPRTAMEVAVVGLAVRLTLDGGYVTDARVAAGAIAPIPFRAPEAEGILTGSELEPDAVDEAAHLLASRARPIDDPRANASYRHKVIRRLLRRAVDIAAGRASEG